jgi:DNA invertase Pin-like site-specific DNA recombinase
MEHAESRSRQYALADHAVTLGWLKERVVVIDEDQGQSGQSAEQRTGFQRLLTEVTLEHVGLILGLEMSRLARSSKDWHHLLEWCALCGTLLGDQDGIYNPNDTNDRLLLGLKGTMSEFELFTMRNRLQRGLLHKAERGEVFIAVPIGYVKLPSSQVAMEPDEQARAVVQLIFDKFEELGSLHRLHRYLVRHNIRIGIRSRQGPQRGELQWRRPTLPTLSQMLHHPMYAGAYVFGRRLVERKPPVAGAAKPRKRWLPMDQWKVLKRDHVPAYISWERYLANQQRLQQNRTQAGACGVPRNGPALLSGLVVCGTCGRRLRSTCRHVGEPFYSCNRHLVEAREQVCYGLKAVAIDDLVVQQVLLALAPAALELSLQAVQDLRKERERLQQHWQRQLERARYEAERSERQYRAVEPENRLVARTLEQGWEEALQKLRHLQEDYDRWMLESPAQLTPEEHTQIAALAQEIPALWQATGTTNADRKEIIRHVVERVVVYVRKDSEYVDATIHWQGGMTSQHQIIRPVRTYAQLRDYDQLLERIVQLRREGHTAAAIAERLNRDGLSPPKRYRPFSDEMVRRLLLRCGLANEKASTELLGPHEWWVSNLAQELAMPAAKLRDWIARGWLHGRKSPTQGLWIVWVDRQELKRLRKLKAWSQRGMVAYPPALTTPKKKNR